MDLSFCLSCLLCCSVCYSILFLLFCINSHFAFWSSKIRKFHYHLPGEIMNIVIMQNLADRLRPLVGLNGWDYCVYWKLSEDQRFLEWLGCCCGGTENSQNGGEDHLFPVSSSCRDTIFPHSRTKPCDLLSQLSTSIPIDSGNIHAQTLLTNQPNWVNYSNSLDPNILEETIGTQVLIPVPGGLAELFVTKQVSEDQQIIDFVTAQCIVLVEQEAANNSINFNIDVNSISNMQSNPLLGDENEGNNNNRSNHFQPSNIPLTTPSDQNSHDIPISLCSSPLNFMQQFNYNQQQNRMKNDGGFSEEYQGGSFLHDQFKSTPEDQEQHDNNNNNFQNCMVNDTQDHFHHPQYVEPLLDTTENNNNNNNQGHDDKDLLKHVAAGRSDSMSDCSDQNEEEDEGKYRRRNGKGNQSKNLVAERKRRKKLNDRLYNLRSLVPRISKLDRASILGDAIEFVKDLQKQVKELQDELEENSDTGAESNCINNNNNQFVGVQQPDVVRQNNGSGEDVKTQNGFHVGASGNCCYMPKQKQEVDATTIDKQQTQQMEPQVEVALIDGNEYYVKVFCEHRAGGFVRLMEALNTLGMDVVNATVTSHKGLVSNVFKVEKKDSEMVEAEDVRDSLLELTRNNPSSRGGGGGWNTNEIIATTTSEDGSVVPTRDQHHLHNHHMDAYHPHPFHS